MAGATISSIANLLKQQYLPTVRQQLNQQSLLLQQLQHRYAPASPNSKIVIPKPVGINNAPGSISASFYGPVYGLRHTLDGAVNMGAEKLMASTTLTTFSNLLSEYFAPAVKGHKLEEAHIHHRHDADLITMSVRCKDCKQTFAQNVSMTMLKTASSANLELVQKFLTDHVKSFFEFIEAQSCADSTNIAAIAAWLTEKLAEHKRMTIEAAEMLWSEEHEDQRWNRYIVEETAYKMGFLDTTVTVSPEDVLPPTDTLNPQRLHVPAPGLLTLPEDHPLAA